MQQKTSKPNFMKDMPSLNSPVNSVYWIHRDQVAPNQYNPNRVAPQEMDLLEHSILKIGFVFPILLMDDGQPIAYQQNIHGAKIVNTGKSYTIIDGFHRYTISDRPRLRAIYQGYVPAVFIANGDVEMITVMMNRAKGVHGVVSMSKIVVSLLSKGVPAEAVMEGMGMSKDEIIRLAQQEGITKDKVFASLEFSKSWDPK